tara:strand:- start:19848 stop:20099 length:252 start_codon:yes stop_codon:yes gene_type:complete
VQFKRLLDTLARSSAQAVTTLGAGQKEQDELKEYLYVETSIEKDFRDLLNSNLSSESVIFLCDFPSPEEPHKKMTLSDESLKF